jgi:uncharacterized protein YndB with AHSA1/START domain
MNSTYQPNPKLNLSFERVVDAPRELIWRAWTEPQLITQWFTPVPWQTVACEIDLRPGGLFSTLMRSPEGQDFPNIGCYLEVIKNEKLVWTNALLPGFRPVVAVKDAMESSVDFAFTAMIQLQAQGSGTKYTATVIHADEATRQKHADLGFHEGWGIALDQLLALVKRL